MTRASRSRGEDPAGDGPARAHGEPGEDRRDAGERRRDADRDHDADRDRDARVGAVAQEEDGSLVRRAAAELLGTFALTFVAAGGETIGRLTGGEVDHVSRAVAPGLLVAAFIYAIGDASGAHFNPAVTLAFVLRRLFPVRLAPLYWAAQLVGAIVAAALLRALFGDAARAGATVPHVATAIAVAIEVMLTWLLVTVILGTADRYRLVGPDAALAVGGTIALCGLLAGPVTGASMNPARSFGPALVDGDLASYWIYLVGPAFGSLLAVASASVLHGDRPKGQAKRVEAASGDTHPEGSGETDEDDGRSSDRVRGDRRRRSTERGEARPAT